MASAASARNNLPDLKTPGTRSVRLGDSFQKSTRSPAWTSLRLNHKPDFASPANVSTILTRDSSDLLHLDLKDGDEQYSYQGKGDDGHDTLVLLSDSNGGYTLETLSTAMSLNLTSAPWEPSRAKLEEQYTLLPIPSDPSPDSAPDPSNAFDFRHYIDTFTARAPTPSTALSSAHGTPPTRARKPPAPPPAAAAAARKPKPQPRDPVHPVPAVVPEVRLTTAPPARKKAPSAPVVEVDLDAEDDDDDDGLILETAPTNNKFVGRARTELRVEDGGGPISLRSAAGGGGSRGGSRERGEDGDVEELVLSRPEDGEREGLREEEEEEEEEEDDELAQEMLRAMMAEDDDDEGGGGAVVMEEEEESEEE